LGLTSRVANFFATPGHRLFKPQVHPADRQVATFIAGVAGMLDAMKDGHVVTDNNIVPTLDGTQVVCGGPNSQPWARLIFEFEGPDEYHLSRRPDAVIPVPFVGLADADEVPFVSMREALAKWSPKPEPIWSFVGPANDVRKPEISDGYRILEWLSVVRIRNFLSPTWPLPEAGYIVHIDGASGIGTSAAKLLFEGGVSQQLLEELNFAEEFQALLPVVVAYAADGPYPIRINARNAEVLPFKVSEQAYKEIRARVHKRIAIPKELTSDEDPLPSPLSTHDGTRLYPVRAVANRVGLTPARIAQLIRAGQVRGTKPATDWFVSLEDLLAYTSRAKRRVTGRDRSFRDVETQDGDVR
jgi:hypothetical protein